MWSVPVSVGPHSRAAAAAGPAVRLAASAVLAPVVPAPPAGSLVVLSFLSGSRALASAPGAAIAGAATAVDGGGGGWGELRDVTEGLQLRHWEPTVAAGLLAEGVLAQVRACGLV